MIAVLVQADSVNELSKFNSYFYFLKLKFARPYPIDTHSLELGDYMEKCDNGEIDALTHVQNLEAPQWEIHEVAKQAEKFFADETIRAISANR